MVKEVKCYSCGKYTDDDSASHLEINGQTAALCLPCYHKEEVRLEHRPYTVRPEPQLVLKHAA